MKSSWTWFQEQCLGQGLGPETTTTWTWDKEQIQDQGHHQAHQGPGAGPRPRATTRWTRVLVKGFKSWSKNLNQLDPGLGSRSKSRVQILGPDSGPGLGPDPWSRSRPKPRPGYYSRSWSKSKSKCRVQVLAPGPGLRISTRSWSRCLSWCRRRPYHVPSVIGHPVEQRLHAADEVHMLGLADTLLD